MEKNRQKRRRRRRKTRGRARPQVFAALDLGTNNCRLLIASPGRDGVLRIVNSFSRNVRLGEGVAQTGKLSEAAIERTVAALKVCSERIRKYGVQRFRAVATEACRQAANGKVLIERAAKEASIEITIVSAAEEARLAAIGCASLIGGGYEGALAFDIGGGSTETIWLKREGGRPLVAHSVSVPFGVMSLAEANGGASDRAAFAAMRETMLARFIEARREMDKEGEFLIAHHHLLGTSGTVTTLAGVALGLPRYVRARVDASWHDCADILAVVDRLAALDRRGRAALGCIGPERADLIVPGCAVFSAIHAVWPCAKLRVADRGLREGILRELVAEARR